MIRRRTPLLALALLSFAIFASTAQAQLSDNLGALSGDNAKGYLSPLPKALSGTLNSAIFQTGAVPKNTFNISLGVRLMGVGFSDDSRKYTPTAPPGFTPEPPGSTVEAPTVIGNTQAVAQSGQGGTTLYHPGGFDISEFAVAVPQLSIGSVFGTRAVVRWISLDLGDSDFGKFDYLGFGAQHSISQYFSALPLDLAAGFFVQQFEIGDELIETDALMVNLTGSKRFGMLEPYAGIGWDTFDMDASYESTSTPGDRIAVKFDKESNAHLTLGLQALLGFARLSAELNVAAETGAAVGLSLGRY
ncbi:MAG: DUF6588 family protein [Candidatus Eisenbacteria bacterium]